MRNHLRFDPLKTEGEDEKDQEITPEKSSEFEEFYINANVIQTEARRLLPPHVGLEVISLESPSKHLY